MLLIFQYFFCLNDGPKRDTLRSLQFGSYYMCNREIMSNTNIKVTTADFIKNYGTLADKALTEPVTITKNGRDRLVMLSADEYERLKRRDRRVVRLEDFSEEEIALIAQSEVPAEHNSLDDELKDWRPGTG